MPDFFADSVFLRPPRARAGQPTLSREQIVKAAIELLDADGATGLSMRKLGTRLGAGATSMYWHVANKDELLELAMDEVMGEVYLPEPADAPWRVALSIWADGMRAMLLRHPWVNSLLGTRPTVGPNAMRFGERAIALLTAAGFEGLEISHVMSAINAHALGSAATESAARTAIRKAGVALTDVADHIEPYLNRLAPDHPNYDKWLQTTRADVYNPVKVWDEGFAFGLDRILDGLQQWLAAKPKP